MHACITTSAGTALPPPYIIHRQHRKTRLFVCKAMPGIHSRNFMRREARMFSKNQEEQQLVFDNSTFLPLSTNKSVFPTTITGCVFLILSNDLLKTVQRQLPYIAQRPRWLFVVIFLSPSCRWVTEHWAHGDWNSAAERGCCPSSLPVSCRPAS